MKAVVKILDHRLILDMEQLAVLTTIIRSAERFDEEHIGKGKGTSGYEMSYIETILPPLADLIRCEMIDNEKYESIKALTAIRKANI